MTLTMKAEVAEKNGRFGASLEVAVPVNWGEMPDSLKAQLDAAKAVDPDTKRIRVLETFDTELEAIAWIASLLVERVKILKSLEVMEIVAKHVGYKTSGMPRYDARDHKIAEGGQ